MQFINGVKPTSSVDKETVRTENETDRIWFNGQNGLYTYKGNYYIIGADVFLEYADLEIAKLDWFGKSESEMWEEIRQKGELVDSFGTEQVLYEEYYLHGLYYRIHHRLNKTVECYNKPWSSILPVGELDMVKLPSLPARFSSFMFPTLMDEVTEIYFDEGLCYWILDEGHIRKTLFSSAEEGEIPEVSYIVEFDRAFFKAIPAEYSIEGRFSSIEEVLSVTEYFTIGENPYEEIDYVKVCLLDRKANDEEIDYIADNGLYWWIKMNAHFEGNFMPRQGMYKDFSYDIYHLYDGCFLLDANERSVLGKYTSFESAYNGAKEEFGEEGYEDDEEFE